MELLLIFSTAFVVGLSGAVMPGPVTAVTMEHTLKRGFIAAPIVTLGHGIMEALVVLALAAGLGGFLALHGVAGAIGIAGGAVLAWMGWGMVKGARSGTLTLQGVQGEKKRFAGPLPAGILATVANPYWFLWWATIGAGYIALSREYGAAGVFLFFSGHLLSDLVWLSLLSAMLVTGKRFINDRVYRFIVGALGVFLVAFAVYFFWNGVIMLLS